MRNVKYASQNFREDNDFFVSVDILLMVVSGGQVNELFEMSFYDLL